MSTRADRREKRWIVLGDDGRHVTLGRHSDPSEDEIIGAANALRKIGVGGWLAILEGVYYSKARVSLMMVRELTPARFTWESAVTAFQTIRMQATDMP